MAMEEYKDDVEKLEYANLEVDPETVLEDKQKRERSSIAFVVGACVLFLLAVLTYTKSPLHLRNCSHHIALHINNDKPATSPPASGHHKNVARSLEQDAKPETCNTAACQKYAQKVLNNFSPNWKTMNPCDNFDAYLCDGFRNTHEFESFKTRINTFDIVNDEVQDLMLGLFNGSVPFKSTQQGEMKIVDKANFDSMKIVWNTCLNEDGIRSYGVKPLQDLLAEFDKVFPAKGPAFTAANNEELTNALLWVYKYGGNGLIYMGPMPRKDNPDAWILTFDSPDLFFGKKHYESSPQLLDAYAKAIAEMQQVLKSGQPITKAPIEKSDEATFQARAKRILDFEKYLVARLPEPSQARDMDYSLHNANVSEVEKMIPEIAITKFMEGIVPKEYKIRPDLTVNVGDINYFQNLSSIIRETPRETLHDYMKNVLFLSIRDYVQSDFILPLRRVTNMKNGLKPDTITPRTRICIETVSSSLTHMYSGLYIDQAFTREDKKLGDQIVQEIRDIFKQRLEKLDWLSSESRPTALKKVELMTQNIGYQTKNPDVANPQEVQDYYKDKIQLNASSTWFEMKRQFHESRTKNTWKRFLEPIDPSLWGTTAAIVNAFYSGNSNSIKFPAGIMRSPFFSASLPDYVSYGAFGMVAGHEVTHAFDDQGSKRNEKKIVQDWWDATTKKNFKERAQCFVDQYSNFTVPGVEPGKTFNVNGKLTLGENIADAGGITAGYEAWKKYGKNNPALPGLESFTPEQLFFVSFGNVWCTKVRKEKEIDQVMTDPHSPAFARILGGTANSAAFREVFNCPVKKPTCALW